MPQVLGFRLGTLDSDPEGEGEIHIMTGGKVPWLEI